MDETHVKIGGGGQDKETHFQDKDAQDKVPRTWLAWAKQHSPFAFGTLKEIPFPSWALPFVLVFFCLIWRGYERNVDMSPSMSGQSLSHFLYSVKNKKIPPPEVLIGGCSMNGMAVIRSLLERHLKTNVGKVSIGSCWIWEIERILKKYPKETKNVRMVLVDIRAGQLSSSPSEHYFRNGETFHFLKDVTDISPDNLRFITKLKENEFLKKSKSSLYLPMKFSLRRIRLSLKYPATADFFEARYTNISFANASKKRQRAASEHAKKLGDNANVESHLTKYSDEQEKAVWQFVKYCKSRNITVVFNFTPTWYNYPSPKPEGKVLTESDHRFLALCYALDLHPTCKVIHSFKNFHEIIPNADDAKYLFDTVHMTKEGATIYTNWLANQMLKDQKIMTALKTPRKPNEFFVKKYAKKGYRKFAGYFKKTKNEKKVMIAQPQKNPVR
ncbi:MAG: hypothetical protein LBQ66_02840 [Planctomycetaceae bacterium]|jgi:hypothetical protein|nr:hypothetical protein [Planctomycetaceae bacterium]